MTTYELCWWEKQNPTHNDTKLQNNAKQKRREGRQSQRGRRDTNKEMITTQYDGNPTKNKTLIERRHKGTLSRFCHFIFIDDWSKQHIVTTY